MFRRQLFDFCYGWYFCATDPCKIILQVSPIGISSNGMTRIAYCICIPTDWSDRSLSSRCGVALSRLFTPNHQLFEARLLT